MTRLSFDNAFHPHHKTPPMTGDDISALRHKIRFSEEAFSIALDITRDQLHRIERGWDHVSVSVEKSAMEFRPRMVPARRAVTYPTNNLRKQHHDQ